MVFGCLNSNKTTVVYLPNWHWKYPSGTSTYKMRFSPSEVEGLINNGEAVATQGGDPEWPMCLACIVMKKTVVELPDACAACFKKYCYN